MRNLIQANTENKRNLKSNLKEEKASYNEIKDRLETVINENRDFKLGVSNLEEFNLKYSKLSDWVQRPISKS